MTTRIPNVEDSIVWGPQTLPPICPEPTFEDALAVVLATGNALRQCGHCQSPATTITCEQYDFLEAEGGLFAQLRESCADCGGFGTYHVPMEWWAAIAAMDVWEQGRTAKAAFALELDNRDDLAALDADTPIPMALRFCLKCQRYVESRDGKAPCLCADPKIVKR